MRLSKQERIGAIIIAVILILGLGGWLLVRPQIQTIIATSAALASKQAEYDGDVEKANRKEPLKDEIIKAYETGEHMADMFFPELASYEADKAFRAFLEQCTAKVVVETLGVGNPTTVTLGKNFYVSPEVEYDLKTYATQGIELPADYAAMIARQTKLSDALGDVQTIGASQVSFTVSAVDRDELIKFVDEVNSYVLNESGSATRKAVKVNGLTVEYWEVTDKYEKLVEELNAQAEEDGKKALAAATGLPVEKKDNTANGTNPPNPGDPTTPGIPGIPGAQEEEEIAEIVDYVYSWSDVMTFYCIERMQDPTPVLNAQDGVSA